MKGLVIACLLAVFCCIPLWGPLSENVADADEPSIENRDLVKVAAVQVSGYDKAFPERSTRDG